MEWSSPPCVCARTRNVFEFSQMQKLKLVNFPHQSPTLELIFFCGKSTFLRWHPPSSGVLGGLVAAVLLLPLCATIRSSGMMMHLRLVCTAYVSIAVVVSAVVTTPPQCVFRSPVGSPPVPVFVHPPCVWPSQPPDSPFPQSSLLTGITLLENATAIPSYGADTWYPAEDRDGRLYSGFDDGAVDGVGVGSACTRSPDKCKSGLYGFHTGSSIVTGPSWRNLSVSAPGGAIFENGLPMQGRYTCANAVINGTWWVGTYGLAVGDASCEGGTGVLQFCEMGPFVGFRTSTDSGRTWTPPVSPSGVNYSVANPLFAETGPGPVKLGAPHVVDHGPENVQSPDGALYMVGNGCLASKPNSNCSWISGDAVFLARARGFSASNPGSLNDPSVWEFFCGRLHEPVSVTPGSSSTGDDRGGHDARVDDGACWTSRVQDAKPILSWPGRVGTVTATWHAGLGRYLLAITTPTTLPSTVGPYDTWVLEAPSLTTGEFSLVSYMPRFGQQAQVESHLHAYGGVGVLLLHTMLYNFATVSGNVH